MNVSTKLSNARHTRTAIAKAVACGGLLLLSSCQIPKLRPPQPGPDLPPGFTGNTGAGTGQPAAGGATAAPVPAPPAGSKSATGSGPVQPASFIQEAAPGAPQPLGPPEPLGPPQPSGPPLQPFVPPSFGPPPGSGPHEPFGFKPAPGPGPVQPACADGVAGVENSAQVGIEAFFNDPTLTGLIYQALAGNRELKSRDEEIQIARNDILARRGAYLPFVNFGARAVLDRTSRFTPLGTAERELEYLPGKHFPDPVGDLLGAFNFTWTPDVWRALRNARDAAGQRFLSAAERRNYFVTRLVAEVAENYYRLMSLDKRMENLDQTIVIQEQSLALAKARVVAGRDTVLAVQRFQAEVQRNQSEKLIVLQEIVEVENRINFLANRFPQPVARSSAGFYDLNIRALVAGVPAQLLLNRPDIREAERELAAAGLDVRIARTRFLPAGVISARVGYESFDFKYLFNPEALVAGIAGELVMPLINKRAIQAEYLSANARQLQTVYNYQRVVLDAFTEVVNRLSMAENYRKSVEIKRQQLESLLAAVTTATRLFQAARVEYIEVLFVQRDLRDARMVLIDTKRQQLAAVVNAYQALGGGDLLRNAFPEAPVIPKTPFQLLSARMSHFYHGIFGQATAPADQPACAPAVGPPAGPSASALPTPTAASAPKPAVVPAAGMLPLILPATPAGPSATGVPAAPADAPLSDAAAAAEKPVSNIPILPGWNITAPVPRPAPAPPVSTGGPG